MKVFGGPKKPRRLFRLNKFGADRHSEDYDAKKLEQRKFGAERHMVDYNKRKALRGQILRYTHMPEIMPRIRALGQKFGHFAFMLALVFRSARLLPQGHPMLNPVNIGRFGIRDVIATAANNLVMKRENMDQIIVFGAVVTAMIMVFIQAIIIGFYAFIGSARASGATGSMFTTPDPDADIVFQFLRHVFGVSGIFGEEHLSVQTGLHALLGFYSTAMMIVAVLIVLYYIVVVVGEAAQSGRPFGGRFNSLWAPIRLVLALGLLVPLGGGLNAAQYGVLQIAKLGSGFATQGWMLYTQNFLSYGAPKALVGSPSVEGLAKSIFGSEACRAVFNKVNQNGDPVQILAVATPSGKQGNNIKSLSQPATFQPSDILFAQNLGSSSLRYVWTTDKPGYSPADATCGGIVVRIDPNLITAGDTVEEKLKETVNDLATHYLDIIGILIKDISVSYSGPIPENAISRQFAVKYSSTNDPWGIEDATDAVIIEGLLAAMNKAQMQVNNVVTAESAEIAQQLTEELSASNGGSTAKTDLMQQDAARRGWGTAGIYYLEIAKANQAMTAAFSKAFPNPAENPTKANGFDVRSNVNTQFWNPWTWDKDALTREASSALTNLTRIFAGATPTVKALNSSKKPEEGVTDVGASGDPLLIAGKIMFGDSIVRLMDNPTLDPMSRLIGIGNDILDRAKVMFWAWLAVSSIGAVASLASGGFLAVIGMVFTALGPLMWFLLTLGLVAGIILAYVLPMIPFMYFFFSVVNWVVEVAEAFISMPLFALAHLRIDGDGLPGQTAMNGYMTLFGIFLRPIMIIIGLIMASLIFGAAEYYLNTIYKNFIFAYRPDSEGVVDFSRLDGPSIIIYIILYVYIVYLLAVSTFKLIDKIPDEMMRWIGGGRGFTGDRPVEIGNMSNMAIAGYAAFKEGSGAIGQSSRTMRDGIQGMRQRKAQKTQEDLLKGMQNGRKDDQTSN